MSVAIPAIPQEGLEPNTQHLFRALGEVAETLTGQRGDGSGAAILRGQIAVNPPPELSITSSRVADAAVRRELQAVIDDNKMLHSFISLLVGQMKAS